MELTHPKRFTVSVDSADYDALVGLGRSSKPPLTLQYLVRLAVRNLLDQQSTGQLTFPLDGRP
jgi:hypothetical protein